MTTQAKVVLSAEDRTSAAFASVMRNADKLGFSFDTLKAGAIGALSALAVPVSVAGIATVFNESRRAIDGLQDLADASGSSVEAISALDNIARSTGGNLETVSSILVKFNGVLADADPNKGVGATLKAIGLSVEELKRLDPAEALRVTAVAVEELGSETDKARVYQELFGKATRDAAPFLKDLAEAKRLDATLTAEQVAQVDKFNKEMAKLEASGGNAARSLSITVAGALNTVIDRFREGQKEGKSFWQIALEGYKKDVGAIYGAGQPQPGAGRVSSGPIIDPNDPRAALRLMERAQDTRPNASVLPPRLSVPARSPAVRSAPALTVKQSDPLGDFIRGDQVQSGIDRTDQMSRAAQRAIEQTRTPLERLNAEQAELLTLKEKGYLLDEDYWRAARESVERYEKTIKVAKTDTSEAIDQAKRLGDAYANTLGRAFDEGMKFGDLLKRLAFDAINIQFLTPAAQKAGNWLGSAVSSLFSFDGGGYTGSGSRSGGIDGKGGFLSVLHPNETVLDHTRGQGMGGGATAVIQQTFNFGNANADTVAQLRAEAARIKAETLAAVPGAVLQARRTSTGFAAALRGA